MWEAIESNKRRSWVLIGLMGALLVSLGFCAGYAWVPGMGGAIGAGAALIFWLVLMLTAFGQGDSILLASARAARISKDDAPRLWNVVEEMTIASGLPRMPAIHVIDSDDPNAFAVGRKPESAAVAVTSGLLKRLNRDELQGVIAHEISHVRNFDVRFMTLAAVMVGAIVLVSDVFLRSLWYGGGGRRSSSSRGGGQAQLVILAVALVLAILAPIAAQLLYFACSRRREYLADASAARYTRYPEGLASALEKIASRARRSPKVNRCLAPLYIVNPRQQGVFATLSSTHPPTDTRVAILRSMAGGAGYQAYEAAYRKVVGKSRRCLGRRTLDADQQVAIRRPTPEPDTTDAAIQRAREAVDLIDRLGSFLLMTCVCGVRIKVPPGLKRDSLSCPRCGTVHQVPRAEPAAKSVDRPEAPASPMLYRRKAAGWESFKCSCGKVIQLSPSFLAPQVRCPGCGNTIRITPPPAA
ncbi:MAG: M48 family metallopeptidase [Phycisphaerales bacterium]|nr:MAG: M48 family metallopeptidase [Phycisphaerales bacterium]